MQGLMLRVKRVAFLLEKTQLQIGRTAETTLIRDGWFKKNHRKRR